MVEAVYVLCALTCLACATLLFRGFMRSRAPFLLWSSCCFVGLAANNILLFLDLVVLPRVDLSIWRSVAALTAMILLLYGLIWDAEKK